jgi:hypothetical protein
MLSTPNRNQNSSKRNSSRSMRKSLCGKV